MHGNLLNDADVVYKNVSFDSVLVFHDAFYCLVVWCSVVLILPSISLIFFMLCLCAILLFMSIPTPPRPQSSLSSVLFFHRKSYIFSNSFLPFIPPLFFSALISLSQCVPHAPAYTNQICLLVLEHRRKELHTHVESVTHSHMDWILFYSPLVHGFDSPTTAFTGSEVQDSSKENAKSEFV